MIPDASIMMFRAAELDLAEIDVAETESFWPLTSLAEIEDARAVGESVRWATRVFRREADPYSRPRTVAMHRAADRAPDLLRYTFAVDPLLLTVFESKVELVVRVDAGGPEVLDAPEAERPALIATLAGTLLRTPGAATASDAGEPGASTSSFVFPPEIGEGSWFSTNPRVELAQMESWASRVDGTIRHGKVHFLVYKVAPRRDGQRESVDPRHWF